MDELGWGDEMTGAEPTRPLSDRFARALRVANEWHADHVRKGTTIPYISHLLGVCSLVLEHGGDEDEAIGALLHDAIEDKKASLEEIRTQFGDRVAMIVEGCTDTQGLPKLDWRPRKEAYLAHLPMKSPSVLRVTAADKLHNARAILCDYRQHGESLWDRFSGGRDGVLWYYRELVRALRPHEPRALVDELARVVAELERLAGMNRTAVP